MCLAQSKAGSIASVGEGPLMPRWVLTSTGDGVSFVERFNLGMLHCQGMKSKMKGS